METTTIAFVFVLLGVIIAMFAVCYAAVSGMGKRLSDQDAKTLLVLDGMDKRLQKVGDRTQALNREIEGVERNLIERITLCEMGLVKEISSSKEYLSKRIDSAITNFDDRLESMNTRIDTLLNRDKSNK